MSHEAVYGSVDGNRIIFSEYEVKSIPQPEPDSDYSYYALQNGAIALVQQHKQGITVTWDIDDRTLSLSLNVALMEALEIANHVISVNK